MNIQKAYPKKLNEKARAKDKNSFFIYNTPIYEGVVLESLTNFADKTITKVISKREYYIVENKTYKNINKLPKSHPVRSGLKTFRTVQGF